MASEAPGREFEVKLEIPAQTVSRVMRLPWLWELATGELAAARMQSIYYDTPDNALRERGVTLRVRRIGAKCVQTIKAAANGAALPIERDEWEEEIAGEEPNLKLVGPPLEGISRKRLQRRLKPCFEIHVDRSLFPIQSANSAIEVAIDRAHIVGEHTLSFCELELELKRGAASEMARIARRIASEVPAALSLRTKAERGFALRQGGAAQAFHGEPVQINASTRVGDAFQRIAWICLRHFALNQDAAEAGDASAVHQMRLGLERLTGAITTFRRLLDGPETDAVKAELTWLMGELAPACELDEFIETTLSRVQDTRPGDVALAALVEEAGARRSTALQRLQASLQSDRYRQLVLRTALWIIAAEWSDASARPYEQPSRRIRALATHALRTQTTRLAKAARSFATAQPTRQAEVFRAVKRLQATALSFAGALDDRRGRAFARRLTALADDLAQLAAIDATERLVDGFMAAWVEGADESPAARKALAMGYVLGLQAPERSKRVAAIVKGLKRLDVYRTA